MITGQQKVPRQIQLGLKISSSVGLTRWKGTFLKEVLDKI